MDIYYIDRKTGEKKKEIVAGLKFLSWLYDNRVGKSTLKVLVRKKLFSSLYGKFQDFSFSKKKISKFISDLEIDMTEAKIEDLSVYKNFNEFFFRELKPNARPINCDDNILTSPADGKILAYENIDIDKIIQVKGMYYSLKDLISDSSIAYEYAKGTCIVVRLAPSDYHRFHFPTSGTISQTNRIDGLYNSVNPIALKSIANLYCQNKREYSMLKSDNFDDILMLEVGATCVGSIIQTYTPNSHVNKGDEKGYFKFGGSTVILFLKQGMLKIDEDIIKNTNEGFETKVNMGEKIGKK